MSTERRQYNIEAVRGAADLVELASRYTRLTQISRRGEFAGPCPVCGGEDRFHVVAPAGRFYCRQCRPRGGDVIDLVQFVLDVGFLEACRLLTEKTAFPSERRVDAAVTGSPADQDLPSWRSQDYQESAHRTLWATQRRLYSREGAAGQEYLRRRGLGEVTWDVYRLGFGQAYHPTRREQRDAIFIPWFGPDGTSITAIQHRFIDPDLDKGERYSLKPGSGPAVFGLQALGSHRMADGRGPETLCIVEGEMNCMSLHQSGVAALSVGSEANAGNERTLALLQEQLPGYERLIVWFDNAAHAEQAAARLHEQGPFRKENMRAVSSPLDANDLLVAGELTTFLETLLDDER